MFVKLRLGDSYSDAKGCVFVYPPPRHPCVFCYVVYKFQIMSFDDFFLILRCLN